MLDRDARITYCNDYLLRLTGWAREEVSRQELVRAVRAVRIGGRN